MNNPKIPEVAPGAQNGRLVIMLQLCYNDCNNIVIPSTKGGDMIAESIDRGVKITGMTDHEMEVLMDYWHSSNNDWLSTLANFFNQLERERDEHNG